jgi:flagellar biosynthesis/type III secretory pathway protein FliH
MSGAYKAGFNQGYNEGLEDGRETANITDQIRSNKSLLNKVCHAWWFKTPPLERVIRK